MEDPSLLGVAGVSVKGLEKSRLRMNVMSGMA